MERFEKMRLKKALLIVDLQNDFYPGGALAVPEGGEIVRVLNRYIKIFSKNRLTVFASRDWHPKKTRHFKRYGGLWPEHCVRRTKGAEFHPKLRLPKEVIILSKGMSPEQDSYSAFQSIGPNRTKFTGLLKTLGVGKLYIGGLATDYCVKYTVLDALSFGLKVRLLLDAVKGVNIKPDDSKRAIEEMLRRGARTAEYQSVKRSLAS